ncbi:hypothetical protein GCM10027519_23250 [Kineococcus endophyticus]
MVRFHPRLIRALIGHHYRERRNRHVPVPPGGRYEPAWYPDLPVSGSPEASYEAVPRSRTRRGRRR